MHGVDDRSTRRRLVREFPRFGWIPYPKTNRPAFVSDKSMMGKFFYGRCEVFSSPAQ